MLGKSLYDDRLYALSKSVLSSRKHVGQITVSRHRPELKEDQKLVKGLARTVRTRILLLRTNDNHIPHCLIFH